MVLVAVGMLDGQLFLEERLPLQRQLSLYKMRHREHLLFRLALEVDIRHMFIICVLLVVDLQNERVARLLQALHELEVHQVEAQLVLAYDHLVLFLGLVDSLLLHIILAVIVFAFLVDYKDLLLELRLRGHGEHMNLALGYDHLVIALLDADRLAAEGIWCRVLVQRAPGGSATELFGHMHRNLSI